MGNNMTDTNNGKKKVMIADDSLVMRRRIMDILSGDGFEIIGQAQNGEEAVTQYRLLRPDLVTMDIVMPKEHGINALKKILEHDPNAKIIIVSGLHQRALLMEALETGAKDYVIKPFTDEELLEVARKSVT